jgi:hypothetical protein
LIYLTAFDGLFWLVITLVVFVFLQRSLHREIQAFFLIITRNPGTSQVLFALLFFPGVFLHETSHFLAAIMLGVKTGRFSLIPYAQSNGKLRLGYVETASGGIVRDSIIGAAPLITGCLCVAYVAISRIHLLPLWEVIHAADLGLFWKMMISVPNSPDFWLWFYLAFTVSSTMMPSSSDRHAWLPLGIVVAGLLIIAIIAGMGSWMLANLAVPFNQFLRALALIFGISSVLHLLLILPFLLIHLILSKLSGMDVS